MKHSNINTEKEIFFRGNKPYNNGFSFPILTGSTNQSYQATSTNFANQILSNKINSNFYSICVDWLEFICTTEQPIEYQYKLKQNPNMQIKKIDVSHNPNFTNQFKIFINGKEICDVFSMPNNYTHKYNEVSIKIANHLLYSESYYQSILVVLKAFKLVFVKGARLDIALDGMDILKFIELLNRYSKSETIQTNNDAITILPMSFKKKDQYFDGWTIGKSKSGISARVYSKSNEIKQSGKDYIFEYWKANGISTDNVGRFEVQLNSKRLDKYQFSLTDLKQLADVEFIGEIFTKEVQSWIKFFRVRKKDMIIKVDKNTIIHKKKELAIQKGSEIQFIKWSKILTKQIMLKDITHISQSTYINARNTISFTLNEILLHPETSTTAQIETVQKYSSDYQLENYLILLLDFKSH